VREIVFMFSGQGSHYYQMGRELMESSAVFRGLMIEMDEIVQRRSGVRVLDHLHDPSRSKSAPLDWINVTHPAIFMVEYAMAKTLIAAGIRPAFLLGASLGTFVAMAVGGCIELEQALEAVVRQGGIFDRRGRTGGMFAVLAGTELWENDEDLRSGSEISATNFPGHFILSAPTGRLAQVDSALRRLGVNYQPLAVAHAFHSRWIDECKPDVMLALEMGRYQPSRIPIICCAAARTIPAFSAERLWDVVRKPIRFAETVSWLEGNGAYDYVDVGPAGTLATFLKYGLPATSKSVAHTIMTPLGSSVDNLAAVIDRLRGPLPATSQAATQPH